MKQEYRRLANIDSLTQAYNRRYLLDQLESEFERSRRHHPPFALIMMDCDNFKQVNDQYGHPIGDEFLIHLVNSCKKRIRATDTLARMGGDEFIILLPETSITGARALAEDLRETIPASFNFLANPSSPAALSLSFGVVSWSSDIKNSTELISKLDKTLYQAKAHGKNCVIDNTESDS